MCASFSPYVQSKDTSCAHIENPLRQTGHMDLSAATLLCLQTLRRTTWTRALDGRGLCLGGGGLVCVGDVCTYMLHPQKATPGTLAWGPAWWSEWFCLSWTKVCLNVRVVVRWVYWACADQRAGCGGSCGFTEKCWVSSWGCAWPPRESVCVRACVRVCQTGQGAFYCVRH